MVSNAQVLKTTLLKKPFSNQITINYNLDNAKVYCKVERGLASLAECFFGYFPPKLVPGYDENSRPDALIHANLCDITLSKKNKPTYTR